MGKSLFGRAFGAGPASRFALLVAMSTWACSCVDAGPSPDDWGKAPGGASANPPGTPSPSGAGSAETTEAEGGAAVGHEPSVLVDAAHSDPHDASSASSPAAPPRRDAGNLSADAGASAPGSQTSDAGAAPVSVFASMSVCSSRQYWRGGDEGSEEMYPGRACNDCHGRSRGGEEEEEEAKIYSVAGTLYPTEHEPDDCYGAHPSGATIHIVDTRGSQLDLVPNRAGNFMSDRALVFPLKVSVVYQGVVREMEGPVELGQGDCNSCHTATGREDASGRIALP